MAELDSSTATTTNVSIQDYSLNSQALDNGDNQEIIVDYPEATKHFGYLKAIPELNTAVWSLAIWTAGKGFRTDSITGVYLDHVTGWGEDSFQSILESMIVVKKICGDAFAEIIRDGDKQTGKLINLKPISPERMRTIVGSNGIIKRYEHLSGGKWIKLKPYQVLHLVNDRIADENRGNSVLNVCKWVIDARQEALTDYRKVLHRNVIPVRIIEVDTDNTAKRNQLIAEYEQAIQKGEVLVVPKGTISINDNKITIQDPLAWIAYLENFFYQAVGIPKVIANTSDSSEASSKVGYLTFEPRYSREQSLLEQDLFNQMGIKIKFNRPAELSNSMQDSEQKNTGQTNFQPKDTAVTMSGE